MKLTNVSSDDLKAELSRREAAAGKRPKVSTAIHWAPVLALLEENVRHLESEGSDSKDFEHYLYEAVLECVYGRGYWDWRKVVSDE